MEKKRTETSNIEKCEVLKETKLKEERSFKRWGDRLDARLVRGISAYQKMIPYMYQHRCNNEAYLTENIDLENLNKYIEMKNEGVKNSGTEEESRKKFTAFDCLISAFVKVLTLNKHMNRFIQNKKLFDRDELSIAFMAKKQSDAMNFDELIAIKFDETTTINDVEEKISSEIAKCEDVEFKEKPSFSEKFLRKLPRFILGFLTRITMYLDLKGLLPKSVKNTDPNYASVYFSNLGEIKLNSAFHHLTNRGTTSIYVVVGERALKPVHDENGVVKMREILPLGITIDERIVDETYLSSSIKLLKFLLQNPEMLEQSADMEVVYDV